MDSLIDGDTSSLPSTMDDDSPSDVSISLDNSDLDDSDEDNEDSDVSISLDNSDIDVIMIISIMNIIYM